MSGSLFSDENQKPILSYFLFNKIFYFFPFSRQILRLKKRAHWTRINSPAIHTIPRFDDSVIFEYEKLQS